MQWRGLTTENRFFEKVQKTDTCWLWIGGRKAAGYGQFAVRGKKVIAHRWSYTTFIGPIPEGFEIDHICANRSCVNPKHLEAVSLQENRHRRNQRKTHCAQGHPYAGDNLRWTLIEGYLCRICRTCARANSRRKYTKRTSR